jgi:hypothetical protein
LFVEQFGNGLVGLVGGGFEPVTVAFGHGVYLKKEQR